MNQTTWTIQRYKPEDKARWDNFVSQARNATFLFRRDYLDYHSDRFDDHSLMAFRNGRLSALLPAHAMDGTLCSHCGLSYGGWILPEAHFDASDMLGLVDVWIAYCRDAGFAAIDYKALPHIYALRPSDEDLYALWRHGATMSECSPSAAIDLSIGPRLNQMQRRHLKSATKPGIEINREDSDGSYAEFHAMLSSCLAERHGAKAVHTLDEMLLLARRFPFGSSGSCGDISLWTLRHNGALHAGVWVFNTPVCVHAQYIATTPYGRDNNLLTPLFVKLIDNVAKGIFGPGKRYFDFGISSEDHGRSLNEGLYRQKASYGASAALTTRLLLKIE